MALIAPIENGKVVETASQSSLNNASKSSSGNSVDKESFLQLLVAQMKYQDPLEPTSNTEYISQYAQFSQVESISNMASSFDLQRASSLVGQEVYIKTTTSTGETNFIQGKVDYVVYENNKPFLSINDSLYSLDDLDTVVDSEYQKAFNKADQLMKTVKKLPALSNIGLADASKLEEIQKTYLEMSDYEKSFINSDMI